MLANFFGVDSEGLYLSLKKETENSWPVFTSFIKRETGKLTLHSGNNGKKMYKKAWCMHVQNCCCSNLTYSFFAVLVAVAIVVA